MKLSGFGNTARFETEIEKPNFVSEIILPSYDHGIARGMGSSYGDIAVSPHGKTIVTTRLNRFIQFDEETQQLICESGVTVFDIQATFLPKKIGLITSPGTTRVTVGGTIANDVHGKNHDHVGSFSKHVVWFTLLLSNGQTIRCSRFENADVFFATIGGLGLTGIIVLVCLQLQSQLTGVTIQKAHFDSISALLKELNRVRAHHTYNVTWLDLTSKKNMRCILSTANNTERTFEECETRSRDLKFTRFFSPFLNSFIIKKFNQYYFQHEKKHVTACASLWRFLYPLDAIKNWNHCYGKGGMYQFQCVIPDHVAQTGINILIDAISQSSFIPYLSVLKTMGDDGEGLLSFSKKGITLAMDFPAQKNLVPFLQELHALTLQYEGRVYLAKDACLSVENMNRMYPLLPEFKKVVEKVDPQKKWQSAMSRRLQI